MIKLLLVTGSSARCQQSSSPLLAVCPSWGQFHLTPIMTFKTCPQGRRGGGRRGRGEPCGKHQTQYTAPAAAASGHTSLLFGKLYSLNSDSFIMMLRNIFPDTYSQFSNCFLFLAELEVLEHSETCNNVQVMIK